MKKLAFAAIACCAFIQSAFSAESPLNTSLIPFQSLIDSPKTQNRLSQDSFIVSFERVTKNTSKLGEVHYHLQVKTPIQPIALNAHCDDHSHHSSHSHRHRNWRFDNYLVIFLVSQDDIGPEVYTLESIRPVREHQESHSSN